MRSREFFMSWLPQLIASSLSVISLVCLVLVLRVYNGRPLTDLDLPPYLTLNTVVAIIATFNRACLNAPICAALMQEMWIYYLNDAERGSRRRDSTGNAAGVEASKCRLKDMDRFYNASNGAWGSFLFIANIRTTNGFAAFFGCLITILSLGYSAFTQQLVGIELQSKTAIDNLPRSEAYSPYYDRPWDDPPFELVSAIYSGVLVEQVQPLQVNCSSGNCTWPVTSSLGVCGACAASTYAEPECTPVDCDGPDCPWYPSLCNYTLPSGFVAQLTDFGPVRSVPGKDLYQVLNFRTVSGPGAFFNNSLANRIYLMNLELFGIPYDSVLSPDEYPPLLNTECALWFCVHAYDIDVNSTGQYGNVSVAQDNITTIYVPHNDPNTNQMYQFLPIPDPLDRSKETSFEVNARAAQIVANYTHIALDGHMTTDYDVATNVETDQDFTSDLIRGMRRASQDPDAWIANLATSMSNVVRSFNTTSRDQYNGSSLELAVVVRWQWLVFPAALVLLSIGFLVAIMVRTNTRKGVKVWKGSPLAVLLLSTLEPNDKKTGLGQMRGTEGWRKALKNLGEKKVELVTKGNGEKKFHTLEGGNDNVPLSNVPPRNSSSAIEQPLL